MTARRYSGKPKLLALIPARGGSKRVFGKNVREFFGHPLIAYAIAAARNAALFERIVVSTDEPAIGAIAEWYGAEYLPRPAKLAGDRAGLEGVALHALAALTQDDFEPEAFCQLMPNSPLRRSADVVEQFERFQRCGRKFQISATPYRAGYPQWALTVANNGKGAWLFGRRYLVASQKLTPAVCPTGAVWWARTEDFRKQRAFYGRPFHIAVMDANRGIDLDTQADFEFAELLVRGLTDRDGKSPLEPVPQAAFTGRGRHG